MSDEPSVAAVLQAAQLPSSEIAVWLDLEPDSRRQPVDIDADWSLVAPFLQRGQTLLDRLPEPAARGEAERAAATLIHERLRAARTRFLRLHGEAVYCALTNDFRSYVRAAELVAVAAERFPLLTPIERQLGVESARRLKDKEGYEIDQGIFLWQMLARPGTGRHLLHAMLRPRGEAVERLERFLQDGVCDLGVVSLERLGNVGVVWNRNAGYLNAEDDVTNEAFEIAVDLAILDPSISVGVLRGGRVDHPKYAGRNVFNAGLNLTRLYQGQLSYLFYLTRDLGWLNKLYRGVTSDEFRPEEGEATLEKPWIAAVEAFAIGGGCQLLLVMDYVLADETAFFNLPARKEGIIPGAANLRLPRFVGDRLARQAILFDRRLLAAGPEGRLLCDEVIPAGRMGSAINRVTADLTDSGMVSVSANRKALRLGTEPLDVFRAYMSTYALEQAYCHFSPALVRNLEQYWLNRDRRE